MAELINGSLLADSIKHNIRNTIIAQGISPGLAIVRIGDNSASELYVKLKKKAAEMVGIEFHEYLLSADCSEDEVLETIDWLNLDPSVHGIVVQLPLPKHLDEDRIIQAITPIKDADGFHPENISNLLNGDVLFEPALVKTIFSLLAIPEEPLEGKNVLIIANSDIFSNPLIYQLEKQQADIHTIRPTDSDLAKKLSEADVIITAVGIPNLIQDNDCKKGAIVIDVGITKTTDGVCGDVEQEVYTKKDSNIAWVTPVPGGVGPVTIAMLLANVLELYFLQTLK